VDYRFQVNLGGIINLLANNLYSGPRVYLRELLQNAVDAIRARKGAEKGFAGGRVEIEVVSNSASGITLICEDNGVGLTEEEVHRFLATIGESSKRGELGEARADFIGQFGIGLLSCFMVADEIVVITRSVRWAEAATEWRGRPDGTYTVRSIPGVGEAGTRVYLRAKKEQAELFDVKEVRGLAEKYGGLLPYPVTVVSGKGRWLINGEAPWEQKYASAAERREALMAYGKQVFETDFFDCVPLESAAGDVHGVAFVLPYSPSPAAKGRHRIYLKRMLLSEAGEGVLPEWAFFVRCVINANGLRPTASREAFYEDDALAAARSSLGEGLREYLLELARTEPARLSKLITLHYLAIKALAVYDEEFYKIFIDWIPFETSLGTMSMGELRRRPGGVKYVPTVDEFRQIARVAAAQDVCVVNAGYTYNEELLLRLPEAFEDVRVEAVGAANLAQSFSELTLEEREGCFDLLRAAATALEPFKCAGDVRRFEPAELAALFTTDPDGALYRAAEQGRELGPTHLSGVIDNLLGGKSNEPQAYLMLNYNSSLVKRLAGVKDRELLRRCIEMLYVQALLLGHHPLSSRELSLLNSGLSSLIGAAVGAREEEKGK